MQNLSEKNYAKISRKNAKFREKKTENIREKKRKFRKKTPGFLIGWVIVMGEGMGTDRNFTR